GRGVEVRQAYGASLHALDAARQRADRDLGGQARERVDVLDGLVQIAFDLHELGGVGPRRIGGGGHPVQRGQDAVELGERCAGDVTVVGGRRRRGGTQDRARRLEVAADLRDGLPRL